jgi:hypothetical protein
LPRSAVWPAIPRFERLLGQVELDVVQHELVSLEQRQIGAFGVRHALAARLPRARGPRAFGAGLAAFVARSSLPPKRAD